MKFFENMRFAGKIAAAALAVAVIGMSTTTAFAAEHDTSDLNSDMYQFTEDLAIGKATIASDGMVEYSCDIKDLDRENLTIVDHGQSNEIVYRPQADFGPYHYEWTCNPSTRHVSGEVRVRKNGGGIGAACMVDPANKNFMFGIMDNGGHATYVNGVGGASHNFYNLSKAVYRVFLQNDYKNTTLYATVSYSYNGGSNTKLPIV